jgi:hypothetical protein
MATTTGRTRWLLERLGARHGGDRFPARYHLPAPQASGSANLPHERPANPRALPYAASLIANLELKFPVSRTKQAKSNRKKMRVLRAPWRIEMPRSVPSSRVSKILIVTPRLEFCAIKTKQTPSSISNRYKTRFSCPNISGAAGRPAVRTASSKEPAGCRHYKKRRPTEEKAKGAAWGVTFTTEGMRN